MGKRRRPGDVLEVRLPSGFGYVQYIGEHESLGGTLWVAAGIARAPLEDVGSIAGADGYYAFYPARTALNRNFVRLAGHAPLGDRTVPRRVRHRGVIGEGGRVLTWVVLQGDRQWVFDTLPDREREVPIGGIWNHEFLVERMSEGWRPEHDV